MKKILVALLLCVLPVRAFAALAATIVWEVRTAGATTNGGGFKTGATGTDWSQQDAAQYSVTDAVTAGTTTITSATANFGTDVVGNVLYIQGGTGSITADWYEITSRTNSTTIVVDRSTGLSVGTGATLNIGGAISTHTAVATEVVAGNDVHVKSGTYAETLTLSVSGGNGTPIRWFGYNATRGDNPTGTDRPFIDGSGLTNCLVIGTVGGNVFRNLRFANATANNVTISSGSANFIDCKSSAAGAGAGWLFSGTGYLALTQCESASNTGIGVSNTGSGELRLAGCYIHDNTSNGVNSSSATTNTTITDSVIDTNAATGFTTAGTVTFTLLRNTVYGQSGASSDGFAFTAASMRSTQLLGNIFASNGRYGVNRTGATVLSVISEYNCYNGNVTAATNNVTTGTTDVTTDPGFTDGPNGNFAVGANPKGIGFMSGAFPGGLSTGYSDIGAVQRQEAAGGSGGGLPILGGSVIK